MKHVISALLAGFVFAVGLVVAGMTQPSKIVGFLDVFGSWDPTLAFVMMGAIGVHFGTRLLVLRRERPVLQPRFVLPTRNDIDGRLLVGAVLFGAGWGLSGYCPGPAITSLATNAGVAWLFVAAMVAGMLLFAGYDRLTQRALVPNDVAQAPPRQTARSSS